MACFEFRFRLSMTFPPMYGRQLGDCAKIVALRPSAKLIRYNSYDRG